ncbi:isochorismate synthase [Puniceicoccaceae bacterium K14]|nr:isochorismate synthase [Puniceicoccaceae bacterium K14]
MKTLPLDYSETPTLEILQLFLESVRDEAEEQEHAQLISITMPADHLDPLAVLESIYEPEELHFYVERRGEGLAIAGAECALSFSSQGEDRFAQSKAFVEETLENTIAVGDEDLEFFGPHFFCAFGFFADEEPSSPFPAARLFVPSWQVCASENQCVAIANALVEADSDVEAIAQRIWNANTKFQSIDYSSVDELPEQQDRQPWEILQESEAKEADKFESVVEQGLQAIAESKVEKVVLARALDIKANQEFHPLEILNTIRERYPDCYSFSVANGEGQSFIGASPERLLRVREGEVLTEALAGSARRGATAAEDSALGNGLLRSEKDKHEQALVLQSICRRFEALGVEPQYPLKPRLKRLQNVQHLHTPIKAKLENDVGIFGLLEALHPTPAVGGTPREAAGSWIKKLESFDRGLYAGAIGWVNSKGEGEFSVSIRSALIEGDRARLYAGVGIVNGSDPDKEKQETDLKFQALKENLL